ncbi:MAG: WHG domain-containing protein [Acidimicrobiales bacterium]|jgi:AcrR family transcriptional regulator
MARAGLNEVLVIEAAEVLADESGLDQMTMARLAARLGVRQSSLYKHVANIDGLKRAIALRAKRDLAEVLGHAGVGRAGADAILSVSHAYRAFAHEHPGRYEAAQRAPRAGDTDDEVASRAVTQVVFEVLAAYELRDDDAVDAARTLRSGLHGFVSLESSGGFGLPVDVGRSFERLVGGLLAALSQWPRADSTSQ